MFFTSALLVSCLLTMVLTRYTWRRRDLPAARAVVVVMAGISWWTLCYALEILNFLHPGKVPGYDGYTLFWFRLMFVGVVALPAAFLVFVLQYTGYRERIGPGLLTALTIMPAITVFLALTDGTFHQWFLGGFEPGTGAKFRGGPAFWLHALYSYSITFIGYGLLVRFMVQTPAYRRQAAWILLGALAASVANMLTLAGAVPESLQGRDLSPFGFLVMALVMVLNVRREGFLDIMPIARSLVFEKMADPVLVTDPRGRLVDRNPSAEALFRGRDAGDMQGQPVTSLLPDLCNGGRVASEIILPRPGNPDLHLSVQHTEFRDRQGNTRGHVYGFRDVSKLKHTEASLREQLARNEELRIALREEAIHDPLTGLHNRRWLDETVDRELARALRENTEL